LKGSGAAEVGYNEPMREEKEGVRNPFEVGSCGEEENSLCRGASLTPTSQHGLTYVVLFIAIRNFPDSSLLECLNEFNAFFFQVKMAFSAMCYGHNYGFD